MDKQYNKEKNRQRKRLYQKAKQSNTVIHWSNFRRARNEAVLLLRYSKNEYFSNIANKIKSSELCAKDWWKTLRTFIPASTNNSIPPLYDDQTSTFLAEDTCKADMLNKYFASQCSIDDRNHDLPYMHNANDNILHSIHITHEEVIDSIKCLKVGKASGPDGIDNRILKEAMYQLSYTLCNLLTFAYIPAKCLLVGRLQMCARFSKWVIQP